MMPVKVKVYEDSYPIPVKIHDGKSQVKTNTGCIVNDKLLNLRIDKEIEAREEADDNLQQQIDAIVSQEGAKFIRISEQQTGDINIDLLNSSHTSISTGILEYDMLRPYIGDSSPADVFTGKIWFDDTEINNELISEEHIQSDYPDENQLITPELPEERIQTEEFVTPVEPDENERIQEEY